MVDEQEPTKRVVKRVVKKTVVRPGAPGATKPQVRYGRPVATATKPRATAQSKTAAQSKAVDKKAPATKRSPRDLGVKVTAGGRRVGDAWTTVAGRAGSAARTSGTTLSTRARAVAAWRLPHINLYLASVITGVVVGIAAVLLGVIALRIFDAVRGVSAGGGLWGSIAFIAIAAAAVFAGDALLRGFGSTAARLTSFLAVVLSVVAMLGLFLDLLDRQPSTALFLVPALGAVAFVASHWLIDAAEKTPTLVE
ncbi:hypothetical protein GEV27_13560 [Aeromicrobium sp. S22]|uniref:hypothetical protein n=1 Tax=Aeromicrobium sp. S22 TaxID=2662029 RepID=UPI00129EC54D|nr:hypothetical protein [Aeromicrobium sp. S22]MRK02543.1 hypothetical protein [Aeromicrobium sp. S22]